MKDGFKHLLIIDDDEDDREFFLQVIGEIFPEMICDTAGNGQIALNKLNSNHQRPDLIFLDLNMPLMNGRQFLREVRNNKQLTEIPVVILSTSSDAQTIQEMILMGAKHFITKPDLLHGWELALRGFFDNTEKYLKR